MERETRAPTGARTAIRVLDIFDLLATQPQGMTLSEIAGTLAVPVSSLHALLRPLLARGYVDRVRGGRRFCLGGRLLEVSLGYMERSEPLARARNLMHLVAEGSGEAVHLAVLSGREVSYLTGVAAPYPHGVVSRTGMRQPAHIAAAGKVLLAQLPEAQLQALYANAVWPPGTPRSPATLADLLWELAEVRWVGYALDVDAAETGLQSIAMPVPAQPGELSAALSVSVPSVRLQGSGFGRIIAAMRAVLDVPGVPPAKRRGRRLIGWSLATTHMESYQELRRAATRASTSLGCQILWTDAHEDQVKQAADVTRLLEESLDALLIQPVNAMSADAIFETAQAAGVLAVCVQRPARSRHFDFFAGGNTYQEGCMQAEALAGALGGVGGVLIIEGDPYNDNARNIAQGNRDTLAGYPGIDVLDSQPSALWSPDIAGSVVAEALDAHGPDRLRGIIAANDEMAVAIVRVLERRGLAGHISVVGGDGDLEVLELIGNGTMVGTAFQDPGALAVTTLQYVATVIEEPSRIHDLPRHSIFYAPSGPQVSVLDMPYTWIHRENLHVLEQFWLECRKSALAR